MLQFNRRIAYLKCRTHFFLSNQTHCVWPNMYIPLEEPTCLSLNYLLLKKQLQRPLNAFQGDKLGWNIGISFTYIHVWGSKCVYSMEQLKNICAWILMIFPTVCLWVLSKTNACILWSNNDALNAITADWIVSLVFHAFLFVLLFIFFRGYSREKRMMMSNVLLKPKQRLKWVLPALHVTCSVLLKKLISNYKHKIILKWRETNLIKD